MTYIKISQDIWRENDFPQFENIMSELKYKIRYQHSKLLHKLR